METENPPPENAEQSEFDLDKIELDRPDEEYPEDFICVLYEFMDDICRMEAHIDAANECLHAVRAGFGNDEERELNSKRAYYLLDTIYRTARSAALRAHEVFPKVVAYCEEAKIKRPEPREEEEEDKSED